MESLDYDILAYLAEHSVSSPKVMAHHLRASGAYLRRRLAHLLERGALEKVGRGLYRLKAPPPHHLPESVAFEKAKATFGLRELLPEERLRAHLSMGAIFTARKQNRPSRGSEGAERPSHFSGRRGQ